MANGNGFVDIDKFQKRVVAGVKTRKKKERVEERKELKDVRSRAVRIARLKKKLARAKAKPSRPSRVVSDLGLEQRQQAVFKKLIAQEAKKEKVNVLARNGRFFNQEPHETKFLSKGGLLK